MGKPRTSGVGSTRQSRESKGEKGVLPVSRTQSFRYESLVRHTQFDHSLSAARPESGRLPCTDGLWQTWPSAESLGHLSAEVPLGPRQHRTRRFSLPALARAFECILLANFSDPVQRCRLQSRHPLGPQPYSFHNQNSAPSLTPPGPPTPAPGNHCSVVSVHPTFQIPHVRGHHSVLVCLRGPPRAAHGRVSFPIAAHICVLLLRPPADGPWHCSRTEAAVNDAARNVGMRMPQRPVSISCESRSFLFVSSLEDTFVFSGRASSSDAGEKHRLVAS